MPRYGQATFAGAPSNDDPFPPPELSVRCRPVQPTFVGMGGTTQVRRFRPFVEPRDSTQSSHCIYRLSGARVPLRETPEEPCGNSVGPERWSRLNRDFTS